MQHYIYNHQGNERRKINQIVGQPHTFGALQNYMAQINTQNQDQTSAHDVATGRQRSGVTLGATQLASEESDSDYERHTEQIAAQLQRWYKEVLLDIVISYFDTKKDITSLLTREQGVSFYKFLADYLAIMVNNERVLKRLDPILEPGILKDEIMKDISKKDWNLFNDLDVNKAMIKDKTRVLISNEFKDLDKKIAVLTELIQIVGQAPDQFPEYDLKELIAEKVSLAGADTIIESARRTPIAKPTALPPSPEPQNLPVNNQ